MKDLVTTKNFLKKDVNPILILYRPTRLLINELILYVAGKDNGYEKGRHQVINSFAGDSGKLNF